MLTSVGRDGLILTPSSVAVKSRPTCLSGQFSFSERNAQGLDSLLVAFDVCLRMDRVGREHTSRIDD